MGLNCHFLLQRTFLTQGLNPCLLHCRWILHQKPSRETHCLQQYSSLIKSIILLQFGMQIFYHRTPVNISNFISNILSPHSALSMTFQTLTFFTLPWFAHILTYPCTTHISQYIFLCEIFPKIFNPDHHQSCDPNMTHICPKCFIKIILL